MTQRQELDGEVVVSGYGAIGRAVCTALAKRLPGHVFAAGRSMNNAETFSEETGDGFSASQSRHRRALKRCRVHSGSERDLICAKTDYAEGHAAFANEVMEHGAHYVDISASDTYLRSLERLDALARRGATLCKRTRTEASRLGHAPTRKVVAIQTGVGHGVGLGHQRRGREP